MLTITSASLLFLELTAIPSLLELTVAVQGTGGLSSDGYRHTYIYLHRAPCIVK